MNLSKIENLVANENNTLIVDADCFEWIFYVSLQEKAYDGDTEEKTFYVFTEEKEDNDGLLYVTVAEDFEAYIKRVYGRKYYYKIKYQIKTSYFISEIHNL